ncbi:unnamed protein product, partial [Rotaria sordida]
LAPADIRREKVTFRHLEKEGCRIAKELNHSLPSSSWYFRFMKRHSLSLQRPKRQDKVPLDEVHHLANSFYMFNRRVSLWSIKRGAMGAFIAEDICNMDESPLALFGDQAKRSINDIGATPADIRREKVTFRHLEKEGCRIAKELNHSLPSSSWYFRFMKRHSLSLQRPKRQDKVPLDEVHHLANSFYMFNRRVSLWSIKRGAMGAFIAEDICNMDESPLALFGDQAK